MKNKYFNSPSRIQGASISPAPSGEILIFLLPATTAAAAAAAAATPAHLRSSPPTPTSQADGSWSWVKLSEADWSWGKRGKLREAILSPPHVTAARMLSLCSEAQFYKSMKIKAELSWTSQTFNFWYQKSFVAAFVLIPFLGARLAAEL